MKLAILAVGLMLTSGVASVYLNSVPVHAAQTAAPPPAGTEPVLISPAEQARLDGITKDFQIAQKDEELARLHFKEALNDIRAAHKFGDDVQYNGTNFYRVTKSAKPVESKPSDKK